MTPAAQSFAANRLSCYPWFREQPMNRKRLLMAMLVISLGLSPFLWGLVFRDAYTSRQQAERNLTLDEDFTIVRKILIRKDGAKRIIEMGGDSQFIRQEWGALSGEVASIRWSDPNWRLALDGILTVRTLNEYVGSHEIELDQKIEITVDRVDSDVRLRKPAGRLRDYQLTTRFSRTERNQTRVEIRLEQEIMTDAPWFAHSIADDRVLAAVERSITKQQSGIRRFIAENRDEVPFFPLK